MRDAIRDALRWHGILAFTLVLIIAASPAAAQDAAELTPSFGNGRLTIIGAGFKAGEGVAITVTVAGGQQQVTTTADAHGNFRLATGIVVRPGQSLALDARGNQGTTLAVTTAVPGMLPTTGAPTLPMLRILSAACILLGIGFALRRRVHPARSATPYT